LLDDKLNIAVHASQFVVRPRAKLLLVRSWVEQVNQ